jgi:hypothetical protein
MWNTAAGQIHRECWPGRSNAHQAEPGERTVTCASVPEDTPTGMTLRPMMTRTPSTEAERRAANRHELLRMMRACFAYGTGSIAAAFGAYFLGGVGRYALIAVAALLFLIAAWTGFWTVGMTLLTGPPPSRWRWRRGRS